MGKEKAVRTGLALAVLEHVRLRELALVERELEEAAEEEDLNQGLGADLVVWCDGVWYGMGWWCWSGGRGLSARPSHTASQPSEPTQTGHHSF